METGILEQQNCLVVNVAFVSSISIFHPLTILCQTLCCHYAFKYQSGSIWTRYELGSDLKEGVCMSSE